MKSTFISDLNVGQELVNEPFLIQDLAERTTKDGRPFLLCTLQDKTGQLGAVYWDLPDYVSKWVAVGQIVLATGRITQYKETIQISITDLNQTATADLRDFLPSSSRSRADMVAELQSRIGALAEPWQALTRHLLLDGAFLDRFADSPAARGMHHAYIGGLLEHSLSMASLADHLSGHYPYVNKDLLVTGALLHDMGKVIEYTTDTSFDLSEDGRLVGHIVRAIVLIETAAAELEIPADDLRRLIHLVASHHGTLEWGSPVVPKTAEAILLHQIDLLDSRMQGFIDHINKDEGQGDWTAKPSKMFNTVLRRPN